MTKIKDTGHKNVRISDEHHKAAKVKAAQEGLSIKEFIENLIDKFIGN